MSRLTHRFRSIVIATTVATVLVVAGSSLAGAAAPPQRASDPAPVHFVELLWLKPGVAPEVAADYFQTKLRPILATHHGQILQSYQVVATMRGDLTPAWINVIQFRAMEDMQGIFKDPEYAKLVPLRDRTFDLAQQRMFNVLPVPR